MGVGQVGLDLVQNLAEQGGGEFLQGLARSGRKHEKFPSLLQGLAHAAVLGVQGFGQGRESVVAALQGAQVGQGAERGH